MAKVVYKTTPKAAYEWAEVDGGDSMSDAQKAALLDEFIEENGLVPVETRFVGEVPHHLYGRYKAGDLPPQALAPTALGGRQGDLNKANEELDRLRAENARLTDQLGKRRKGKADVVDGPDPDLEIIPASGGGQSVEEARANLNTQDGVNLVGASEEIREDMSTADRSDDNPKVK